MVQKAEFCFLFCLFLFFGFFIHFIFFGAVLGFLGLSGFEDLSTKVIFYELLYVYSGEVEKIY